MVDLRDKDNCEKLISALSGVPDPRIAQLSLEIQELMSAERELDAEITAISREISLAEIQRKMSASSAHAKMHVHAFYTIDQAEKEWQLRVDSDLVFSDYIQRVEFRFQEETPHLVVWDRRDDSSKFQKPQHGVILTRPLHHAGPYPLPVQVSLYVGYPDQLYEVPAEFHSIANNSRFSTLVDLFKIICMYIRSQQLSSDDDPSYFTPDAVLHRMLYSHHPANHPVSFASLLDTMKAHFRHPAGPFEFTVNLDPAITDPASTERVHVLTVEVPKTVDESVNNTVKGNKLLLNDTVNLVDEELARISNPVIEGRDRAIFLTHLAENPVGLLQEILKNPTGAVRNVESTNKVDYSKMTTSDDFYRLPWAVAAAAHIVQEQRTMAS